MNVEIINIGDELLIGQVVNTNAAWMASELSLTGFTVVQVSVVRDEREHILEALARAEERASVVLISGGIGPTLDDITKHTLCEYFNTTLVFNEEAYKDVEALFSRRGYPVTELNRRQAELPESCISIPNRSGTARGMWFEKVNSGSGEQKIFVSMPGVPFEMKEMMTTSVLPMLKARFRTPSICHRTILTQGVGESFLAARIEAWEKALPPYIKLAYLPQPGIVRLRLTGKGDSEDQVRASVNEEVQKLYSLIPEHIFGEGEETLEQNVGRMLKAAGLTITTAESCTGGYIAHLITSVAGSSDYYLGSVVAYSNQAKINLLGVDARKIELHGAVSEEVVSAMARGARDRFGSDVAIATSGIAGPAGGTDEKPVGTTWVAVATARGVVSRKFLFGDSRERNIRRAALACLMMTREILKSND